jgi:biopolymer transport protein ExbD
MRRLDAKRRPAQRGDGHSARRKEVRMAASVFFASASAASRPAQGAMAGINITPLVDVMLVLLVIFMVTMPIRSDTLGLSLPGAGPPPPGLRAEPVQLQVQADGSVLLDGARVELPTLVAELRAQRAQAPEARLSLDSSGDAEYRAFAMALAAAREAGYRDIAIRR